jgi:hypothetical protein
MKIRKLITLFALLAALAAPAISNAEETGSGVVTVIDGTTIGGTVDSTTGAQQEFVAWWHRLLYRLRFHRHH